MCKPNCFLFLGLEPSVRSKFADVLLQGSAEGSLPWQIYWSSSKSKTCHGIIIDSNTILTYSSCHDDFSSNKRLSLKSRTNSAKSIEQIVEIEDVIQTHNAYVTKSSTETDLLLLKLRKPIRFSPIFQPACLPALADHPEPKQKCIVSKFTSGSNTFGQDWSSVTIGDPVSCTYGSNLTDAEQESDTICETKSKNCAFGTFKGVLMCGENGNPVLTGFVGSGKGCNGISL